MIINIVKCNIVIRFKLYVIFFFYKKRSTDRFVYAQYGISCSELSNSSVISILCLIFAFTLRPALVIAFIMSWSLFFNLFLNIQQGTPIFDFIFLYSFVPFPRFLQISKLVRHFLSMLFAFSFPICKVLCVELFSNRRMFPLILSAQL